MILLYAFLCVVVGVGLGRWLASVSQHYKAARFPERVELVDVPPAAVCTPSRVVMTAHEARNANQLASLARQFAVLQAENERRAFLTLPEVDLQDTKVSLN